MYLHHPQILRAVELARSGALGRLELVNGTFSFYLTHPGDPRVDPSMGGGSLWDVGCYPVSLARRIAGEEPDRVGAFARFDERGVDRTFIGQLHFPGGLLAQFDSGFAAPDRERVEIVGGDATLVLDSPFLPAPDGPPPSLTMWRGREATTIAVASVDQYRAEVEDLTAAILDGTPPRIHLAFSRGTIGTLVDLDRAARANAGLPAG
jgi:predicted dehydrogenase